MGEPKRKAQKRLNWKLSLWQSFWRCGSRFVPYFLAANSVRIHTPSLLEDSGAGTEFWSGSDHVFQLSYGCKSPELRGIPF